MKRAIIGLCGPIGAGKSEIAKELERNYGYARTSFAEPIKLMLAALLTYRGAAPEKIERMLWGDLKDVPTKFLSGRTPRFAMQTLGTEWGRTLMATSFWPDAWGDHISGRKLEIVSVDDLRFPSEAVQIAESGGIIVGVSRSGVNFTSEHESERMAQVVYSGADLIIANNSTVQIVANDLILYLEHRRKDGDRS